MTYNPHKYTRQSRLPKRHRETREEVRARLEAEANERIARAWAPSFEGQERFGDDR